MEVGWKDYIQQYLWKHDLMDAYWVTQDDVSYGESLINTHFPVSWKEIKFADMKIPEIYDDSE